MLLHLKIVKKYCEIFKFLLVSIWMASNLFFMLSSLFMHSLLNLFIVTVIIVFLCSNRLRHGIEALSRTVDRWRIFSQIGFTEHANEVP